MRSIRPLLIVLLLAIPVSAEEIRGKFVSVADGDTLTVLDGTTQVKVRLLGIDAPEEGQAFGNAAKKQLSERVFGKTVKVVWEKEDKYGWTLGDVYLDEHWVNREHVEAGCHRGDSVEPTKAARRRS
jgi:endonuclease YncB( thermonuclease family)